MVLEPVSCHARDALEGTALLEQMGCPRNDLEPRFSTHPGFRALVELDHDLVAFPDQQQRRSGYQWESLIRKIRPSPARDYGPDTVRTFRRRNQGRAAAGACSKQADRQSTGVRLFREPVRSGDEAIGEHRDVESMLSRDLVQLFLLGREKIEEKSSKQSFPEHAGNEAISAAEPAATASVGEQDDPVRSVGNSERSLEHYSGRRNGDRSLDRIVVVGLCHHSLREMT